jgi:hypothetical protein
VEHPARMLNLYTLALIAALFPPAAAMGKGTCPDGGTCGIDCDCPELPDNTTDTSHGTPEPSAYSISAGLKHYVDENPGKKGFHTKEEPKLDRQI